MKKILFPALVVALSMAFTSCDGNDDPATETFGDSVATLIVPADQSQPASAQMVQYTFNCVYGNNMMQFGVNGLNYEGNNYKFLADNVPFSYNDYYNGRIQKFSVGAISDSHGGAAATGVQGEIATIVNFRPADIADFFAVLRQYNISYKVGNLFTAKTFPANAYYFGSTMTTYVINEQHREFTSDSPVYNVVMDLKAESATIAIYNATFASEMPVIAEMQLEGLKVEYTHDSYVITGANIVPKVREGSLMVPNPNFTINSFTLQANSADLRNAQISFKVAGRFDAMANVTCNFNRYN